MVRTPGFQPVKTSSILVMATTNKYGMWANGKPLTLGVRHHASSSLAIPTKLREFPNVGIGVSLQN